MGTLVLKAETVYVAYLAGYLGREPVLFLVPPDGLVEIDAACAVGMCDRHTSAAGAIQGTPVVVPKPPRTMGEVVTEVRRLLAPAAEHMPTDAKHTVAK